MKTKYRTDFWKNNIEMKEFDITKETDSYFWVGKTKYKKSTNHESFFDTFEDAQQYLIEEAEKRIQETQNRIENDTQLLKRIHETKYKIKDLKPF